MPSRPRPGPPGIVLPVAATLVVVVVVAIGSIWGAEAFITACMVGSILAGLVITSRE